MKDGRGHVLSHYDHGMSRALHGIRLGIMGVECGH